ncbi:MAG: RagB/SusD family nutrient uptake outer membrane protein [Bacteroidales bacterium]|nr:RagB/SusD family nutrient uptake outer membrane protein [Bacteroidales bacterium]
MKKLTLFVLIIAAACMTLSCEGLLDVQPVDKLTPDSYFKNENELQLYSNRFYNNILPGGTTLYKEVGDNLIWTPLADEVSGQREVPETGGAWTFTSLRQVNFFLEHLGNCKDQAAVRKYRGIAKFFRAWFYFDKVKHFGDVPWIDHVPTSDDPVLYKARDSREVVMTNIFKDLDDALEDLSKTKNQKDVYRVGWWTVQALKSRIGLFEGTFRKYHGIDGWEKYLDYSIEASEAFVLGGGGFSLMSSYRDMFTKKDACKEYILARDYDKTINLQNSLYSTFNSPGQGRCGFTRKFINTYLNADGTRFQTRAGWETMEFKDEVQGRDPRLKQTIRTDLGLNFNNCITGYQPLKYIADDAMNIASQAYNDLPLIRLAEIYLNYAEAKAERGTLTQEDLDNSLNKLRDRALMDHLVMADANANPDPYLSSPATGYVNVTGANKGVILEIRRERNIELVLESQLRYYDIMRWKEGQILCQKFEGIYIPASKLNKAYDVDGDSIADICVYNTAAAPSQGAVTYIQLSADGITLSAADGKSGNLVLFGYLIRKWDENRDYYYPIPREDVILTDGVVAQNPGW